jgi:glycerol kinase
MLFNINTLAWDEDLIELFEIPRSVLPEVRSSSEVYGETSECFSSPVKIAGIAGDQQAALFGQMCVEPGMVKNTYGTGCFMVMNVGKEPIRSNNKLLTTIAWQINDTVHYAIEGSIFIAGAVVQWLRDGLGIIGESGDIERLSSGVKDSGGVYFVPAFAGLGAPHWSQHARGTIFGITRGTTSANIARAALDSIAFQTYDVLRGMQEDAKLAVSELRVDGGATVNNDLMQFQADLLQARVVRPQITETTALGAAYLAGLAVKYWDSLEEIKVHWKVDRSFMPGITNLQVMNLVRGWHRAVKAVKVWADEKGSA